MSSYQILEYVWLDKDLNLRSKTRTIGNRYLLDFDLSKHLFRDLNKNQLDIEFNKGLQWSYDGSSTGQAPGDNSEIIIRPVYIINNDYYNQKYNTDNYYIAFCQTFDFNLTPLENNNYNKLIEYLSKDTENKPYFGFEQEFFITQIDESNPSEKTDMPVGFYGDETIHQDQQQYYCSNGPSNAFERNFVNTVYNVGLKSGLKLSGLNSEVAIGQWEIQVGPIQGVEACHQLWLLRFLLNRISEDFNVNVNLHPKILPDWNGSGLHTNFSNNIMRKKMDNSDKQERVYQYIIKYIESLEESHELAMQTYGDDNELRMTGECETASFERFTYGIADRGSSIRIPINVKLNKYGYIEDRRPASNADPYNIYSILTLLNI
uniref:glutamine synthetase n=1 Tax=viral metagenome TaxID=1070528 RepID=A0A6C0JI31_9ZZZZ